jgi:hypothetical protein
MKNIFFITRLSGIVCILIVALFGVTFTFLEIVSCLILSPARSRRDDNLGRRGVGGVLDKPKRIVEIGRGRGKR